jgi:hypothetical protein
MPIVKRFNAVMTIITRASSLDMIVLSRGVLWQHQSSEVLWLNISLPLATMAGFFKYLSKYHFRLNAVVPIGFATWQVARRFLILLMEYS